MKDNSTGKDKDFYSKGKQTFDNIEPIRKQTIADVCVIARNAIDRITELEGNKPRRKWVGLTDEEFDTAVNSNITITDSRLRDGVYGVALDIAALLKKKNTHD